MEDDSYTCLGRCLTLIFNISH